MKKSKIVIVFAIFLMFIAIGTVNATDNHLTDDSEDNLSMGNVNSFDSNNGSNMDLGTYNSNSTHSSNNPTGLSKSAADIPNTYIINDSTYSQYFNSDGSIKNGAIKSGDILDIQGTLNNKNFKVSIPLNFISISNNGKLINGTITISSSGSGSNVTGLIFVNSNNGGHGVHLTGTENNTIENCSFTLNGINAYSIPVVKSNYNRIIGNTIIQTPNTSGSGQVHSLIVLGDSNYNIIENNTLTSQGSNAIYLCPNAFADYSPSYGSSNYNNITNNTIYGVSGDYCWAIAINGNYNNVKYNTIRAAEKSISSSGNHNNITNNNLQAPGVAITASGNYYIIANNYINQTGSNGINFAGKNSSIRDNTIFTTNGNGIYVTNGDSINITDNSINTKLGNGILVRGENSNILVKNNNINSINNTCIVFDKESSTKFPKDSTIGGNTLNTTTKYVVDVKNADKSVQLLRNDIIQGSGIYLGANGVEEIPSPIFNGETLNINDANFDDFFNPDGSLKSNVNDNDILNFSGSFYNRNMTINSVVKLIGSSAYFYNTTIIITSPGARIENLNIINANQLGIIIANSNNVEIRNNNITVNQTTTAYGIYVFKSDNVKIFYNTITAKGDFLTFGILLYGSNDNVITGNTIIINGTGVLYNLSETCIDGGICVDGGLLDGGAGIIPEIYQTYGIILIGSDNNKISNNVINATSALKNASNPFTEGTNSIVGIDIYYDSHNNEVIGNNITIEANDPFLYGMGVLGSPTGSSSSSAKNNTFKNNIIDIYGPYYVAGFISGQNSINTTIANNKFSGIGGNYSYGIILESSEFNIVTNNTILIYATSNYGIEMYGSNNNIIHNNEIRSGGSNCYGIAAYNSSRNNITSNIITVSGNALEYPVEGTHKDVIPYGNAGILLMVDSNNNNIANNRITSSGEYAINASNTANNNITNNYLNATSIPDKIVGKTGADSVYVTPNKNNNVADNYIHIFDGEFSDNIQTTVNGTVRLNVSISSETGNISDSKVQFYIKYGGDWIPIGYGIISNGYAYLDWKIFSSMKASTYEIRAVFSKDNFENYTVESSLDVKKGSLIVTVLNSTGIEKDNVKVSAKVTDIHGSPVANILVQFFVNGYEVGRIMTNSEGIATLIYKEGWGYKPGKQNVTAYALSSDNYDGVRGEGGVLTLKDKTNIIISAPPINLGKSTLIKVTLTSSAGKPLASKKVYIMFGNLLMYQSTTDSKGVATFKISGLPKGRHNFVAYFPDNDDSYGETIAQGTQIVQGGADLIITTVKRSGNNYKITIKNQGTSISTATKLKIGYGKKYKIVNVGAIESGKSKIITVKFFKYSQHKKFTKYAEINYNKATFETSYKNNKVSFKASNYQRFKANLAVGKISRSGNKYNVIIKNQGTASSGKFKIKVGYGKKYMTFTGNSIAAGKSVLVSFKFFKYSQHKNFVKYIQLNYNKAIVESNYKNNLKKFKV
ncbi:bacterial Ig-like domain protein [Methanobrevibacter cuticularis]|uniref:Bacterial Ig-like domain protein n=1 Tax=Methanobrevibacter cuticularis TaxID=47311 RepID=A0A166DLJ3_9EURY|nr:right-handed parallel beta-helix repeat-containing protein [Methanobrevibacter cuticularis]KZX15724.1 bacterial Ig-like domain protein [Methanobrevibacter cuticularis]